MVPMRIVMSIQLRDLIPKPLSDLIDSSSANLPTRTNTSIARITHKYLSLLLLNLQIWKKDFGQKTCPAALKRYSICGFGHALEKSLFWFLVLHSFIAHKLGEPFNDVSVSHCNRHKRMEGARLLLSGHMKRTFSIDQTSDICAINFRDRVDRIVHRRVPTREPAGEVHRNPHLFVFVSHRIRPRRRLRRPLRLR